MDSLPLAMKMPSCLCGSMMTFDPPLAPPRPMPLPPRPPGPPRPPPRPRDCIPPPVVNCTQEWAGPWGKITYVLLAHLPYLHGRLHLRDRRDLLLCHQNRLCHQKHLPQSIGG